MMHIDFLLDVFRRNSDRDAVVWRDQTSSYAWLADAVEAAIEEQFGTSQVTVHVEPA